MNKYVLETVAYDKEILTRCPNLKSDQKLFGLDVELKKLLGKRCRNNQSLKLLEASFFSFSDSKS